MKITVRKPVTYNIRYFKATMHVRHWINCSYSPDNGETWFDYFEDTEEENDRLMNIIPCVVGEDWEIVVDLWTGKIINWPKGFCLRTYFKVCDEGEYVFLDVNEKEVINITDEYDQCYVPDFLCIEDDGYGDYVIINIDGDGKIENFDIMEDRIKAYFNNVE